MFKAGEFLKAIDENVAQVEAHLADVRNFFEQGLLTKNEVFRVEVQLSNARLARLDAANAVEIVQVRLNSLLGLPLDTEIEAATRIGEAAAVEGRAGGGDGGGREDGPGLLEKALDRRPDLERWTSGSKRGKPASPRPGPDGIPRSISPGTIMTFGRIQASAGQG